MANEIANKKEAQLSPTSNMNNLLKQMAGAIEKALPQKISSERFQRIALTAFSSNEKLQNCTPTSFLAAMMQSAQLGLEPNTPLGQAYLIPYGKQVQFQVGYKGMLELAQRSGEFKSIYAHVVYEHDEFEIEYGLNQKLVHKPFLKGDRGESVGYYAVYHLTNGGEGFSYMPKSDVLKFAKEKSKTFNNGPWQTDFDAMAKKTVIKQLLKYAPMSIETQRFLSMDETIKEKIQEHMEEVSSIQPLDVETEIATKANQEVIDIQDLEEVEEPETDPGF